MMLGLEWLERPGGPPSAQTIAAPDALDAATPTGTDPGAETRRRARAESLTEPQPRIVAASSRSVAPPTSVERPRSNEGRRPANRPPAFEPSAAKPAPGVQPSRLNVPARSRTALAPRIDETPETTARQLATPRERSAAAPPVAPIPSPAPRYGSHLPVTPPVDGVSDDQSRVADVLRRYARAYGALDANAARDVWPSVDQRALARAFESLRSQELSLQDCEIDVQGATANASCRGQAQYVGKVGSGEPRIEPRTWRFELRREGEAWKIANAEARRPTS
jgi:hypothetical protein